MRAYENFNSIKVRLRLEARFNHESLRKFQFHKGSIKTDEEKQNAILKDISIP